MIARSSMSIPARIRAPARHPHPRATPPSPLLPADGRGGDLTAALLGLQRTAGNRATALAVAQHRVQRAPTVVATPATRKTTAQITALTMEQFNEYANGQADWADEPSITPVERDQLTGVLAFARGGKPAPMSAMGLQPVQQVLDTHLTPPVREQLRNYARGVDHRDTAGMNKTAVVSDALKMGDALGTLEAGIPRPILHLVMGTTDDGFTQFAGLVGDSLVASLVAYYGAAHPTLEADNGADIASFRKMNTVDGTDPRSYVGTLPQIHNYHRFLAAMLNTLRSNLADHTKTRPLLLILHSGSDHNGAFHRDDELKNTVQHPRNLTIMVEGEASLEALGTEAQRIAKAYGVGGKIGQVMLAGHGNTRVIEMAGHQRADGTYVHDDVNLDTNRRRTEAFLRKLIRNVAPGPDAHILLNACLTAADTVSANLPTNPAAARRKILGSLAAQPSLASRIGQLAPGIGVEGNVSSVGAGHYMSVDAAGNPTGLLHGTVDSDPFATTSNRADYVEHGEEPGGCLRATVALWAIDKAECLRRVDARRAAAISGWHDRVVHVFYDILHAAPDNIALLNRAVNSGGADGLSEFELVAEQTPGTIGGLVNQLTTAELHSILTPLYAVLPATGQLAMDAAWMFKDTTRRATFMTVLDSFPSVQAAENNLSDDWVGASMRALLPAAAATAPSSAQAKLALYGVTGGRRIAAAVSFLRRGAAATGHIAVPAGTTVDTLTGSANEDDVLITIGLRGAATTTVNANFDSDGDGVNDIHLDSVTRFGVVTASALNLRAGPALSARILDHIPRGERLYVFGTSGQWLAVDRPTGGTGFVHRASVRTVPEP